MKTQSPDTHPDIEKILIEGYRRMSPAEKFESMADMSEFVRDLSFMDVRRRYPDATERECKLRAASRWIPRDLMIKAFNWDPDEKGY